MGQQSKIYSNTPDPCIMSVLDSIFHVSQIDPEWVQPDYSFEKELDISREQVLAIGRFALNTLRVQHKDVDTTHLSSARTPRELVSKIKKIIDELADVAKAA